MDRAPRDALSSLDLLRRSLDGTFAARADGLLASGFALLDRDGREFGRLRLAVAPGAELRLGDQAIELEASGQRLRMVADGEEMLVGTPKARSIDELVLSSRDRIYEARFSFFRNRATASRRPGGGESARLSGGITGRSYEAIFDAGDACALPVAVFILWHLITNRRRAYLAGPPSKGGKM